MTPRLDYWQVYNPVEFDFGWGEDDDDAYGEFFDEYYEPEPAGPARWIGPGEMRKIAGWEIPGMVYVGSEPPECRIPSDVKMISLPRESSAPWIDLRWPITSWGIDRFGTDLTRKTGYCGMVPDERRDFLEWLASGASSDCSSLTTIALYLFGLEYRFFVEQPDVRERKIILEEAKRLLNLPRERIGLILAEDMLEHFVTTAGATLGSFDDRAPLSTVELGKGFSDGFEFTFGIRHAVGRMTAARRPLTAEWLLSWYLAHPSTPPLCTSAKRAPDEFMALFRQLFDEAHPDGVRVHIPKSAVLRTRYVAASGMFECQIQKMMGRVPDCRHLRRPLTQARKLVDRATDALRPYSTFVGRKPERKKTVQAHLLLPPRLRPLFPSPPLREFEAWVKAVHDTGELVTVMQVVHRVLDTAPKRLQTKYAVLAASALGEVGFGMIPDVQYSLRNPRASDPVELFEIPKGDSQGPSASMTYNSLLVTMAGGMYVAHGASPASPYVRDVVHAWLGDWGLSPFYRARALAHLAWFVQVRPGLASIKRHLLAASNETRQEARLLALAVAAADGTVHSGRARALGRIYRAMELQSVQARSDLQALGTLTEFVTTRLDRSSGRVRRVGNPRRRRLIRLDDARILYLLNSSEQAYRELERVFADAESIGPAPDSCERVPALDIAYTEFLHTLVSKPHWEATELSGVAQRHQIMLEGALEAVNDWCSELFGDVLVQEHDGFDLDPVVRSHLQPPADA